MLTTNSGDDTLKQKTTFRLHEETILALEQIKKEHGLSSFSDAIEWLTREYRQQHLTVISEQSCQLIADRVKEELDKTLTRIRLGANTADRNSKVALMLLNTLLAYSKMNSLITEETSQLTEAKECVRKEIETYRLKKLEREKNQKKRAQETNPEPPSLLKLDGDLVE